MGPSELALGFMPAKLRGNGTNIELGGGQAPKYLSPWGGRCSSIALIGL